MFLNLPYNNCIGCTSTYWIMNKMITLLTTNPVNDECRWNQFEYTPNSTVNIIKMYTTIPNSECKTLTVTGRMICLKGKLYLATTPPNKANAVPIIATSPISPCQVAKWGFRLLFFEAIITANAAAIKQPPSVCKIQCKVTRSLWLKFLVKTFSLEKHRIASVIQMKNWKKNFLLQFKKSNNVYCTLTPANIRGGW